MKKDNKDKVRKKERRETYKYYKKKHHEKLKYI